MVKQPSIRQAGSPALKAPGPADRARGAFSMIELLLVVMIMMLTAALAVPSFIRSYQGAKLRTSVRTIVMAHRHARATSVLQQKQSVILFDVKKNEIEIISVSAAMQVSDKDKFLDGRANRTGSDVVDAAEADKQRQTGEKEMSPVISELVRKMADGVKIVDFESEKVQEEDGIYWVNYYPNGMCDPYELRVVDDKNQAATVKIDGLSGSAEVEYD